MLDDALNKKIREAAEQYHPAYDDGAWKKMASKLGEEMPEEKKKKRRYLLVLPFLLLLGGSVFVLFPKHNATTADSKKAVPATQAVSKSQQNILPEKPVQPLSQQTNSVAVGHDDIAAASPSGSHKTFNYLLHPSNSRGQIINGTSTIDQQSLPAKANNDNIETGSRENNTPVNSNENSNQTKPVDQSAVTGAGDNNSPTDVSKNTQNEEKVVSKSGDAKQADKNNVAQNNKTRKSGTSFGKNFGINISAGPDVSAVAIDKVGRVSLNFGLGVSYALSDKFTLRSGFYVSDKIYSADKTEYTVPYGGNTTYLATIDANCIVYEIPLAVSYNFSKVKNNQWFGSAGLSSYLMRKETYDYFYKYPSGYTDAKTWSISNQNKYYFSVLDLSVGYEHYFSKKTSLIAEPYVKVPLAGVGAGKVKLNSGGILFTLRVKPFYKQ